MPEGYDASDPKQVADARAAAGRRTKRLETAIQEILASPNGRFWIWDFLSKCHVLRSPYVPGLPSQTDFNLGEQNIGLQLFAQVGRFPDLYGLMIKENTNGE